jgi:hypothetical protein
MAARRGVAGVVGQQRLVVARRQRVADEGVGGHLQVDEGLVVQRLTDGRQPLQTQLAVAGQQQADLARAMPCEVQQRPAVGRQVAQAQTASVGMRDQQLPFRLGRDLR